jgi:hypothetical protein
MQQPKDENGKCDKQHANRLAAAKDSLLRIAPGLALLLYGVVFKSGIHGWLISRGRVQAEV